EKLNIFRGRITDANNNPLPFANISNTHDNVGTYSDAKGYFALVSSDSLLNVQVKSIGFENKLTHLKPSVAQNKIILQPDTKSVSSVVLSNANDNAKRKNLLNRSTVEEPEPADGWVNYDTYIANNLVEPESQKPKTAPATGEVQVSFDVNDYGEPVNIKVDKSLSKACDAEAIRLIKEGPKWKNNGKKRVTVSIPFSNN
ncbi:MAG: carboxypeptidase-like regulatory domain-containing protein, partial [Bacteroidetes bacterium]|nr:carboxypeptidase-like regulatory domain-containing protein [Bacteroidota bacterium]